MPSILSTTVSCYTQCPIGLFSFCFCLFSLVKTVIQIYLCLFLLSTLRLKNHFSVSYSFNSTVIHQLALGGHSHAYPVLIFFLSFLWIASTGHHHYQSPPSGKSTRLNILSPEKVHRLGARLSDQKQKLRDEATSSALNGRATTNANTNGTTTAVPGGGGGGAGGDRRRRAAAPPPPPVRTHFNTRC